MRLPRGSLPAISARISAPSSFARRFEIIGITFFCDLAQLAFGLRPHFAGAEIFLGRFRIAKREPHAKAKSEFLVKSIDNVPDFEKFLFHLGGPAEYMRIVLRDRKYARETAKLSRLFVAVDHRR